MSQTRYLPVPDGLAGLRVDAALARLLGISRSQAAKLVADGQVEIDDRVATKSDLLVADAMLRIAIPAEPVAAPEPITVPGMNVVFDDQDIVVIDKPVGVAAHPSPGWQGPTVTGALAGSGYAIATSGAAERQGVVHRLDVGTSGLMVVAKSELAYTVLKRAFRERTVDKIYHALVQGLPDPTEGTIDAPIGRHPKAEFKFAVVAGGKPSITHYRVLEAFGVASLVEVHLETGRTHQIRVHFAAIGHPCVGDPFYGSDPVLSQRLGLSRQWLHATTLAFAHPRDGRPLRFDSPHPSDLAQALARLQPGASGSVGGAN